eukprot:jgi/Bigna1/74334/fgenesh1_pg.28_\
MWTCFSIVQMNMNQMSTKISLRITNSQRNYPCGSGFEDVRCPGETPTTLDRLVSMLERGLVSPRTFILLSVTPGLFPCKRLRRRHGFARDRGRTHNFSPKFWFHPNALMDTFYRVGACFGVGQGSSIFLAPSLVVVLSVGGVMLPKAPSRSVSKQEISWADNGIFLLGNKTQNVTKFEDASKKFSRWGVDAITSVRSWEKSLTGNFFENFRSKASCKQLQVCTGDMEDGLNVDQQSQMQEIEYGCIEGVK